VENKSMKAQAGKSDHDIMLRNWSSTQQNNTKGVIGLLMRRNGHSYRIAKRAEPHYFTFESWLEEIVGISNT